MRWNVENIAFLHPPDIFTGSFDNPKMQARHEQQAELKLMQLKAAVALETDPLAAMMHLHTKDHLTFLLNNQSSFAAAERLEKAVLKLYRKVNGPFSSGRDMKTWYSLFEACDRARLYNLGEPFNRESATVYRGAASGTKRCLSWSPDRQRAEWFAERWKDPSLGGGEIHEVHISKSTILIYLNDKREEELILDPTFIKSAEIGLFNSGI